MSNSPLVNYTKLVKNYSKMTNKVNRKITIHHMAGNLSVEACANVFNGKREASANYGIGSDGRIGLYVEESNRAWTSSSKANDSQAVTIEVANNTLAPNWTVSDKAMASLINLCVDICKRNGIKKLLWFADKSKSLSYEPANGEAVLTVHRWFANKSCPGNWLYNRLGNLASKVNASLGNAAPQHHSNSKALYRVQTGAFKSKSSAKALEAKVKKAGFETCITVVDGLYKVQVGAYSKKESAKAQAAKLKAAGFKCFVTTNG